LIILTRPDGKKIMAKADSITMLSPDPDRFMGGNTIVRIDGENHGVMETVDQIDKMLSRS